MEGAPRPQSGDPVSARGESEIVERPIPEPNVARDQNHDGSRGLPASIRASFAAVSPSVPASAGESVSPQMTIR
jgi:hypothetical protein